MAKQIKSKDDLDALIKEAGIGTHTAAAKKLRDAFDKPAGEAKSSATGHGPASARRSPITTL